METQGLWSGIKLGNECPSISHLLFADDSLFFAKANDQSIKSLLEVLNTYEAASGQKVNFDESRLYCSSNISEDKRNIICRKLGVQQDDGKGIYLGMPYMIGRSKKEIFAFLRDRMWRKLTDWKEKYLSYAGKEVLIKSVIQAIPTYIMSCFKLPKGLYEEFTMLMRNFWWGKAGNEKRIFWKKWESLCTQKTMGGMGFREMESFNLALLAKQGWRIIKNPDSLAAKVLKAKYFAHTNFLEATLVPRASYLWRSLLEGRKLLTKGLIWRVGRGENISIWDDPWVPLPTSFKVAQYKRILWPEGKVQDLIDNESGRWKVDLLNALFLKHEVEIIKKIPLSPSWPRDELLWYYSKDGIMNVKSAYHLSRSLRELEMGGMGPSSSSKLKGFWNTLWKLIIPQKIKVFLWRACCGILPTGQNLRDRIGMHGVSCSYCSCNMKTDKHIFIDCDFAQQVWEAMNMRSSLEEVQASSFKEWFAKILDMERMEIAEIIAVGAWLIWKSRNDRTFAGKISDANKIGTYAIAYLSEFQNQQQKGTNKQTSTNSSWTAPSEGILKINVDGAFTETGAGIGVVVRDHQGNIEALMAEKIEDALNPEHVECLAFLKALHFAKDYGITHFILEGDALGVVQRINKQAPDQSMLGNLINCCKDMLPEFDFAQVRYVNRKCNSPAHLLAHKALLLAGNHVWLFNYPKDILYAAKADFP